MYRVTVKCGGLRAMSLKIATFSTKEEAVVFMTAQLNKVLNNPNIKKWDVTVEEIATVQSL